MRGSDGVHEDEFQIIEKLVNRMARSQYDFRDCLKDAVDRWRLPDTVEVSTLERLEILDSCIGSMISSDTQIILERGRTEEAPIELTAPVGIALPKQSAETANQLRENLIRHCEEARRTEPTEGPACFFEDIRLYLAHALGTDQISMADAQRLGVLMVESYRDKIRSMEDPFTDPPESPTQRAARQAECVQKFREYAREIRGILGEG
jgi:hypothetical protein